MPMRLDLRSDGWNLAERLEARGGRLDAERLEARGVGLCFASLCTPERYDVSDGHDEASNAEEYDDEEIVLLDAPIQRSEAREVSIQMKTTPVTTNMRQLSPVRSSFEGPPRWRSHRSNTEGFEMMPAPPGLDPTLGESRPLDHLCADFAAAVLRGSLDPVDPSSTAKHVSIPKSPSFGDASVVKSCEDASTGEEPETSAANIPLQHNTDEKATKSPDMDVRSQSSVWDREQ